MTTRHLTADGEIWEQDTQYHPNGTGARDSNGRRVSDAQADDAVVHPRPRRRGRRIEHVGSESTGDAATIHTTEDQSHVAAE